VLTTADTFSTDAVEASTTIREAFPVTASRSIRASGRSRWALLANVARERLSISVVGSVTSSVSRLPSMK
jgi:hypothetical protein